jgi:biopolymer transport protein ExbB
MLAAGQLDKAISECDAQRGSVANVVKSGLNKYRQVETDASMDKESKVISIQKELEEATTLELPMLSKNLVIISTCASIATLVGLIGTVLGMIRAFSALAQAGAPDATALATGISEALINTALGIIGSAIAIVMYNYFTSKIDSLTYSIDEAGYTIVQTFASKNSGK